MTAKIARISECEDSGMVIIEMHHVDENDESFYFDVYICDPPPEGEAELDTDEHGRVFIQGQWVNRWVEQDGQWVERPDMGQARRRPVVVDYDQWLTNIMQRRERDVERRELRGGRAHYANRKAARPQIQAAASRRPQAPPGLQPRDHPKKEYKRWKERPARDPRKGRPSRKQP